MRVPRSYLYVPGNRPALFEKASAGEADAVILDLEDAVPFSEKDTARATVADWLAAGPAKPVWVRINSGELGMRDAAAIADLHPAGVVMAKAEIADVARVVDALGGGVAVSPLLETPSGVLEARGIAGIAGVAFLQIGEYDLSAEIGVSPGPDESELLWARSAIVFASAAAGIAPPVAPVSVEIADRSRFEASTRALARLGFVGRACIHPAQVAIANRVFTPSEEDVAAARSAIEGHRSALRDGSGVAQDERGRLVDEATIRSSRRVLALAGIDHERSAH